MTDATMTTDETVVPAGKAPGKGARVSREDLKKLYARLRDGGQAAATRRMKYLIYEAKEPLTPRDTVLLVADAVALDMYITAPVFSKLKAVADRLEGVEAKDEEVPTDDC